MALSDDARVTIILADYIGVDAADKLNIIGGGWTTSGLQPSGATGPQYVAVVVDLPAGRLGEEFSVTLELHNERTGEITEVVGPTGNAEALRISQLAQAGPVPAPPGLYIPSDMFGRVQVVIAFPNGLPLATGTRYSWRASIDGHSDPAWRTEFLVAGPPPAAVFGGPAGLSTIPESPTL